MSDNVDWEQQYKDLHSMMEDKTKDYENLQKRYFQLEYDVSMENIDAKFEPMVAQNNIEDVDFSRDDYPYLGKARHSRKAAEGYRTIRGQRLSETGYGSEVSEELQTDSNSESFIRKQTENSEKVKALNDLKEQADTLENQIESQRVQLKENMISFDNSSVYDELNLVDSEIATQTIMLREADQTLNQILDRMSSDVQNLNGADFGPEVDSLKSFLKKHREKQQGKLNELRGENENLFEENRTMKASLKNKDRMSRDEIDRLNGQLRQLDRDMQQSNQDRDKSHVNDVKKAEERVRLALEEKLNEMWQPAEVLNRIASFVDSDFRNVGNDELSPALENIRSTATEISSRNMDRPKGEVEAARENEHPLRFEINKTVAELRIARNAQHKAEEELVRIRSDNQAAYLEIDRLKLRMSETDGIFKENRKQIKMKSATIEDLKKEMQKYNQEVCNLHNELLSANTKLAEKEKQANILETRVDQLKREYNAKENGWEELNLAFEKATQRIQENKKEINHHVAIGKNLNEEIQTHKDKVQQIRNDFANVKNQLKSEEKLTKELKNKIKQLRQNYDDRDYEYEELNQEFELSAQTIRDNEKNIKEQTAENKKLKKELNECYGKMKNLENALITADSEVKAKTSRVTDQELGMKHLNEEYKITCQKFDKLSQDHDKAKQTNHAKDDQIQILTNQLELEKQNSGFLAKQVKAVQESADKKGGELSAASQTIQDNTKEMKQQTLNNEEMKKENDNYSGRVKQLTDELSSITMELSTKEKETEILGTQIEQLKREDENKNHGLEQLTQEHSNARKIIHDKNNLLQNLTEKLSQEKDRSAKHAGYVHMLKNTVAELRKDLNAAKRQKNEDTTTKEQIKHMRSMLADMQQAENTAQSNEVLKRFHDRFDEVLAAIVSSEKRLGSGSKTRSGKILSAVEELYRFLLNNDEHRDLHGELMDELNNLKNKINNYDDEFYYVPSGHAAYVAGDVSTNEQVDGASQGLKVRYSDSETIPHHNKRSKRKTRRIRKTDHDERLDNQPMPILLDPNYQSRKLLFLPENLEVKAKKRYVPRTRRYSIAITSRPEKVAIAHSDSVLRTLQLI